jgi:flagellar secretion chaperone FliS
MATFDPLKAYRQHAARTDSVPDVVMYAYERLASYLHAAAQAAEARDIEKKTQEINNALTLLIHLEGALDFERGGDVALLLKRFYKLVRQEIAKGSAELNARVLREAAAHALEMRKVWEESLARSAGAVPSGNSATPVAKPLNSPPPPPDSADAPSRRWRA